MATQKPAMTINQACLAFGISSMCLHSWRKGTPTKNPLPTLAVDGRSVLIGVADARKWAKAHGVEFAVDPDKVLADKSTAAGKPGPKSQGKSANASTSKAKAADARARKEAKPVAKKSALAPVKAKPRKQIGKAIAAASLKLASKKASPLKDKKVPASVSAEAQPA